MHIFIESVDFFMGDAAVVRFENYMHTKVIPLLRISEITTVFYFEFTNRFSGPAEMHRMWEFVYVDRGRIIQRIGEKAYPLKQGEYIFIPPGDMHQLSAHPESTPNVFIISFMCASRAMNAFANRTGRLPKDLRPYIAGIISEATSASQAFGRYYNSREAQDLLADKTEAPGAQQMIRSCLEQMLILLYRAFAKEHGAAPPPLPLAGETGSPLVNQAMAYIRENVYSPLSVSAVCGRMGYSNPYLSALFRQCCHCSITEYISRVKIDSAKALIRRGATNFTEIAATLCYSDPHYFSRVFRRVTGMSPSEYRKSILL